MASSGEISIEDAPATFKSFVWRHFGYPVVTINGDRVTDKTRTICKHCKKISPYTSANTSTMHRHLQNHHRSLLDQHENPQNRHRPPRNHRKSLFKPAAVAVKAEPSRQTEPPQLPQLTDRAAEITRDIGIFIAADLTPFSVVENVGFKRLLNTLEPNYTIPTRGHFSHTVVPSLYKECKTRVVQVLKDAESVAMTTEAWSFRGTLSYVTVTAHAMSSAWEMVNVVLLTRPLFDSRTGANMAEVLLEAVSEWELKKPNRSIAIVTDDVDNTEVAVRQSPTAAAVLKFKQKLLQLPCQALSTDVRTRWNSTLDMLSRYLEQQAAIAGALSSPDLGLNTQIDALDSNDMRDTEDLVRLLDPLKTATTVLCEEKSPPVSLIVPLKSMIEQSMTPNHDDSTTVADTKRAILSNISGTYSGDIYNFLLECTALDPRFRTLPLLDGNQREAIFLRVQKKVKRLQTQTLAAKKTQQKAEEATPSHGENWDLKSESELTEPASKKTALEDLLGDSFSPEPECSNVSEQIRREIEHYRREASIPLSSCPLRWWKENSPQYPLLSPLAKAYLSIPVTSVPSQRVFSAAGDIVNAQRSQLLPEHLDMLIFLNQNMTV
ncbi:E3 SUMO-protein ligase ZBED1 isoform X3 [Kryptolebias marmoratus]|uniref:E3 SUMO-protein ligase ZBED1 isoform X3 n=1 Tax=Kryptolebias marmoratus TaxID=37003 RepID=UPI0007F8C7A7|nr:E3 SUMO-protein ligase ZBED1 isoform X3 [Kryptolebias marmoratus]